MKEPQTARNMALKYSRREVYLDTNNLHKDSDQIRYASYMAGWVANDKYFNETVELPPEEEDLLRINKGCLFNK